VFHVKFVGGDWDGIETDDPVQSIEDKTTYREVARPTFVDAIGRTVMVSAVKDRVVTIVYEDGSKEELRPPTGVMMEVRAF
jgi:hypothetical protein